MNSPKIPALLIRDHGITVWASSWQTARNYIELIDYIFRYMVAVRQLGLEGDNNN
ncbi:class II aldolase/adducin family protein [Nostoc sp. FACHB-190]|nr:class II aldolase/adducin family protein [Nostoc sp. FACHB-190]